MNELTWGLYVGRLVKSLATYSSAWPSIVFPAPSVSSSSRFLCTVIEGGVEARLASGAVVVVPLQTFKRSATLKDVMHSDDAEFTLVLPDGYLEAWVECVEASIVELQQRAVASLAHYLKAADFLADSETIKLLGGIMGLKMRAGRACSWSFSAYTMFSGRSDLSEDQRDAIQVLSELSSEAVQAVLKGCVASLHWQLAQLPECLHSDAVRTAFPLLRSEATLELNCTHHPTATLTTAVRTVTSLQSTSCLVVKNAFLATDGGVQSSVQWNSFVDALGAAVQSSVHSLTIDRLDVPVQFIESLLGAATHSSQLQHLDVSFPGECLLQISNAALSHFVREALSNSIKRAVETILTNMRHLKRLTLRRETYRTSSKIGRLVDFDVLENVAASLWMFKAPPLLIHLQIDYIVHADSAHGVLLQLPHLQSLSLKLWYKGVPSFQRLVSALVRLTDLRSFALRQGKNDFRFPVSHEESFSCFNCVSESLREVPKLHHLDIDLPFDGSTESFNSSSLSHFSSTFKHLTELRDLGISQLNDSECIVELMQALQTARCCTMLTCLRLSDVCLESADACISLCTTLLAMSALVEIELHIRFRWVSAEMLTWRTLADRFIKVGHGLDVLTCLHLHLRFDTNFVPSICAMVGTVFADGLVRSLASPDSLRELAIRFGGGSYSVFQEYAKVCDLSHCLRHTTSLQHLELSLATSTPSMPTLLALTCLTCLELTSATSAVFASLRHLVSMQKLLLSSSGTEVPSGSLVGTHSAAELARSLHSMHDLRELYILSWDFGAGAFEELVSFSLGGFHSLSSLEKLHLSNCSNCEKALRKFAQCIRGSTRLRELAMPMCHLDDQCAAELTGAIRELPCLYALHVSGNEFGGEGIRCIAELLRSTPTVMEVFLCGSKEMGKMEALSLLKAIGDDPLRCTGLRTMCCRIIS